MHHNHGFKIPSPAILPPVLMLLFAFSGCSFFSGDQMRFRLLDSKQTGIYFSNDLEETNAMNIISYPDFYSGGGVAIGDVDNDGLPDVFFTGNQVASRLYKNKGNMRFEDITQQAGFDKMGRGWYTGVTMVDINADGYLDIYISKSGMGAPEDRANLLYVNNQNGTFTEQAKAYGLDNQGYGVNAAFIDYDHDGDMDVYVANQVSSRLNSSDAEKLRHTPHPYAGDKLYENRGDHFVDVTTQAGIFSSEVGFAHGVAVGDINGDGWEDLFVSNDFFEYDYLYLNNGDKTFTESIKKATRHISNFSMGNDLADYDNDGLLDLVVLDMVAEGNRRLYANTGGMNEERFQRFIQQGLHHQYMFNMLHKNNGNETFSEVGMLAGISRTDWSWAPLLADFDNDGWKDLFVSNGIRKDIRNIDWGTSYRNMIQFAANYTEFSDSQWHMLLSTLPSEKVENYMFHNNGDISFSKVMDDWGLDQKSWSNGVAYGDLDKDGDLDLVINNVDEKAFVYENMEKGANFLRFKFVGPKANPMGLGTKVWMWSGGKEQYQQFYTSRGYRSSVEPVMHFGVGKDTSIAKVKVVWPDGREMELHQVKTNQVVTLDYQKAAAPKSSSGTSKAKLFMDITDSVGLQVKHRENMMMDFISHPMLPYKLSSFGPPLAVADVNGDGLEDFYLGGSFRNAGQMMLQQPGGKFVNGSDSLWMSERMYEDVGAAFFDLEGDGDMDLYVVSGGSENTIANKLLADRLYINDGKGHFMRADTTLMPTFYASGKVIAPKDYDGDGDTDLFVGGRIAPGNYPILPDSYLLVNNHGKLSLLDSTAAPEFKSLGMVTGAVWSDVDSDQDPDLVVVGEWMPVTIFINDQGRLSKMNGGPAGLDKTAGWWWSISAGDLDNDGDEDFVLGNMGLNYKFKASEKEPLELFYGDIDKNGRTDMVMGYHQKGKIYPTADLGKSIRQFRYLRTKITSNNQYAVMDIYDIYGRENLEQAQRKKIVTLASGVLYNQGNGKFTFKPFDNTAQTSNINAILIRDFNNDSHLDLLMAGNYFDIEAETIRNDAGIGWFMRGDGNGDFISVPFKKSGLFLDGDIRALQMITLGNKPAILAARNNDQMAVYTTLPIQ